jgi:glycolate oxidase FAD binding subunit
VDQGSVAVLLEGTQPGVEARAATTRQLLGPDAREQPELPRGWGAFPWNGSVAGPTTALKATFALSGLARVLGTARAAAADAGVRLDLRGSGGAGVLYGALSADAASVAPVVDRLRAECTALGGALVVLDAPAVVKAAVDVWGPVPVIGLMRRVKDQFDPERRLAPGRFVGGI